MTGQKRKRVKNGFTLIELLVVMFIITLISSSVLAGYWSGQKQNSVSRASQLLAANLRRAQNMALAGVSMPSGCLSADCAKGFGLYTKSANQYIIFYNSDETKMRYVKGGSKESTDMETITLSSDTSLSPANKDVYFTPPEPLTYINGANSGSQVFTISSGNFSKTVTVYASGKIDIE